MSTKLGKKVKHELEMVGGCYYDNYGVNAYLLENGDVCIQAMMCSKKIYTKNAIIPFKEFEYRFRDESLTGWENFVNAMKYLDLWQGENE